MIEGRINTKIRIWIFLLVIFHIALYSLDIPVWVTAASALALVYRYFIETQKVGLPKLWLKIPLVLGGTAGVLLTYNTILGQEPATSLLIIAVSLKVLESVKYRDAILVLFLCYYLLMGKLLIVQSFVMTIVLVADVLLITLVILSIHQQKSADRSWKELVKPISLMVLKTLPFLIVMFFLFPRFSTGFFRLQTPPPAGTGFSDKLDPGDLSSLAQSDRLAFRVKFLSENKVPMSELYWRGGILWTNNEMTWTRDDKSDLKAPQLLKVDKKKMIETQISLEPQYGKFLFALDRPLRLWFNDPIKNRKLEYRRGQVYQTPINVSQRLLYFNRSDIVAKDRPLTDEQRERYLQVPRQPSTQMSELLEKLSEGADNNLQKSQAIIDYLNRNDFRYSLEPGVMTSKTIDEFVFNKKVGFCEHFSAVHAGILRWMGVPARVVVGFQGGKYNDIDEYYFVTDKDAHAWTEFWSDEQSRWIRSDPTSGIAPLRNQMGGQDYFSLSESQRLSGLPADQLLLINRQGFGKFIYRAKLYVDAAANRWNLFLLKYDYNYQRKLFKSLGFGNLSKLWLFVFSVALSLVFFWWWRKRAQNSGQKKSQAEKNFNNVCLFLNQKGLIRAGHEGPLDFKARIIDAYPEQEKVINEYFDTYMEIQFQESHNDTKVLKLRSQNLRREIRPLPQISQP